MSRGNPKILEVKKVPPKRRGLTEEQVKAFYARISEIRAGKLANNLVPFAERWRKDL